MLVVLAGSTPRRQLRREGEDDAIARGNKQPGR